MGGLRILAAVLGFILLIPGGCTLIVGLSFPTGGVLAAIGVVLLLIAAALIYFWFAGS